MSDNANNDVNYREKIIHILSIYPVISPTMLQMGIGPGISPKDWRPHLNDLIEEGIVVQGTVSKMSPAGRYHQYQQLHLSEEAMSEAMEAEQEKA